MCHEITLVIYHLKHGQQRLQNLSVCLCGAAHRKQYRAGGPIIINSGFRCEAVNRQVGGVKNSQHLIGQAADIRPKDPAQFPALVDFFRNWEFTDQLLTASTWLHISWNPFSPPRHYVRIGYYK